MHPAALLPRPMAYAVSSVPRRCACIDSDGALSVTVDPYL